MVESRKRKQMTYEEKYLLRHLDRGKPQALVIFYICAKSLEDDRYEKVVLNFTDDYNFVRASSMMVGAIIAWLLGSLIWLLTRTLIWPVIVGILSISMLWLAKKVMRRTLMYQGGYLLVHNLEKKVLDNYLRETEFIGEEVEEFIKDMEKETSDY